MIEIYMFMNPIGTECYQAERQVLKLVKEKGVKKIQFRFVPFLNMHIVDNYMRRRKLPRHDLKMRNEIFRILYSASLDYKAIQLQGKKRGRAFLLKLQERVGFQHERYTEELVERLILEIGGDLEECQQDRPTNFVKEAFTTDQQVAHDMGVVNNPSCVIYNFNCDRDFGVLLEGDLCKELSALEELCETTQESLRHYHDGLSYPDDTPHLHLI